MTQLDRHILSRRNFLQFIGQTAATAAAGTTLARSLLAEQAATTVPASAPANEIHVAIIGTGTHGRQLLNHCTRIPGIRVRAVCDIWPYNLNYAVRLLKKYQHPATGYADYQDMLTKEKDIEAVIIATPDWMHAEQSVACLKAGWNVYCEKEIALTIDDARNVVTTARQTGKLLQVGRQHRSNPRYLAALDLIEGKKALGTINHVAAQWHGHKRYDFDWPKGQELDEATLKKYGYDTMERLRNWRWYAKYSAGEMINLGSHQIDVLNWFLRARPVAVYATGGLDVYAKRELYDNINAVYEWQFENDGRKRTVRGNYEILNTTEVGGIWESFTGDEGTLTISELAEVGGIVREPGSPAAEWEKTLQAVGDRKYPPIPDSVPPKPPCQCHLENFFDAIRGKVKLTCPGEVAFETAVSVLRANQAIKDGRRLTFRPEDFVA